MKSYVKHFLLVTMGVFAVVDARKTVEEQCIEDSMQTQTSTMHHSGVVKKHVLENGMTILVYENHTIPKVSLQIWYKVGSKDEGSGEKGIAHLIEHMIFKGTSGQDALPLSESDMNMIGPKLSAELNAFTTQDFTGYRFDLPTHNWKEMLPIIADCMLNCSFKDEHLNSEMKAVIQELKMRKDNYVSSLAETMLGAVFPDHPYHYPIIGFKQDLWNVKGADLRKFYKKHYVPNNATLVVVGDVNAQEVFALAQEYFGDIEPNWAYERPELYLNQDISSKSVTLYRDVTQPICLLAYVIPGLSSKTKHVIDLVSSILGSGKSSRLYKILVDECQLATSLGTFHWSTLFDHGVFFIIFEPKRVADIDHIICVIQDEIDDLVKHGVKDTELTRSINQSRMKYYSMLENMQEQAFDIGKLFLATGDENYVFDYLNKSHATLQKELHDILKNYFRASVMHKGMILPLPEEEKKQWLALQTESDLQDERILSARQRDTDVEGPGYVSQVKVGHPGLFSFPKAQISTTKNGIKILAHHNDNTPKISVVLQLKAKDYYDPADKQGLYNFVAQVMTEGTENYTATELADELESRGINIAVYPGGVSMSMLSSDLKKGLELLLEILTKATFEKSEVEKIRAQIQADIKNFWDNPAQFSGQIVREHVYKGHPYSKNSLGDAKTIAAVTQQDLIDWYKKVIVPGGARLAIVGDLTGYDVPALVESVLGNWHGKEVPTIQFPVLQKAPVQEIVYPINRDQVVLCFAGLSVDRKDKDYDKLVIFDQILGAGALGSMSSRLFKLREQSGLFYSINGSLTSTADEQPGMVMVKTMVSLDRLPEAERAIRETLAHAADTIEPYEFEQAKNAIATARVQNFESNSKMATAFLFLDRYGFPADYFDKRTAQLDKITIAEVQEAVKRVLRTNELSLFKIGRCSK